VTTQRLIGCAVALVLLTAGLWPLHVLQVREPRTGRWLIAEVVAPGDGFALSYTHSVVRKPVRDTYTVDPDFRIIQTQTVYPGTGFGLPSEAAPGEVHRLLPDGSECIAGMRRVIPQLVLRVERAYHNTFTFNDAPPIELADLCGDVPLELRVHSTNAIRLCIHILGTYGDPLWPSRNCSKSIS
jgi:hypothetical protein